MILKEKQFITQTDRRLVAGCAAEKQMAFYLKREFGAEKDIWVINDLRIGHGGEFAQIDHLLVSQWGLFIVESKSVTESVHINAHGEWAREYGGKLDGMPSPVLQAEAQGRILRHLLLANKRELLGTIAGMQKRVWLLPLHSYVAISDSGIIHRGVDLPQVMKADAVAPAIRAWLRKCSLVKELFSLSLEIKPGGWKMSKRETEVISKFLLSSHTPLHAPVTTTDIKHFESDPISTQEKTIREGQTCPECGQHVLVRKSITRGGASKRDFLACEGYPKSCKAIYPLPAINPTKPLKPATDTKSGSGSSDAAVYEVGDACPWCKEGKLVERKGKSIFLGCSNYGTRLKCTFKDYSYKAP
jgi:Nuclease-related domain./Topoisomerase DNA binding C4 zinc finger.